jgi:hypothetical protein
VQLAAGFLFRVFLRRFCFFVRLFLPVSAQGAEQAREEGQDGEADGDRAAIMVTDRSYKKSNNSDNFREAPTLQA